MVSNKSRYIYGLDLGSNTLRGTILDCKTKEFIFSHESIVRTADGITKEAKISKEALNRIISAIQEGKEFISKIDIKDFHIKAVATEALRRAKNRDKVLKDIEDITGIRFEIIDGYEEARLTMEAVRYRLSKLGIDSSSVIAIDIGGGSTEISIYNNGNFQAESFKVGILTLSQKYESIKELKEELKGELRGLLEFVSSIEQDLIDDALFVVTAGTPTTIAALKYGMNYNSYNPDKINGTILTLEDIDTVSKHLKSISPDEVTKAVGAGREELIPTGIAILKEIYNILHRERAIVIDDGLREGVAISICKKN